MSGHTIHVSITENTHDFLQNIRREIMIENCTSVTFASIVELGLMELRMNNKRQTIKEKLIHNKRIGKEGINGKLMNIKDD